jgi:hypothetical protein
MSWDVVLSGIGIRVDGMEGVGHALKDFLQADHLAEQTLDVSVHDMFLTGSDGVWAVLERC